MAVSEPPAHEWVDQGPGGLAPSQTGSPASLPGLLRTAWSPANQPMLTPLARLPGKRFWTLGPGQLAESLPDLSPSGSLAFSAGACHL